MARRLNRRVMGGALALAAAVGGCGNDGTAAVVAALRARRAMVATVDFSTATSLPANPPPAVAVTIADPPALDAFDATLALPVMPPGAYNCPADFGVTYQLVFRDGAGADPPVATATLDPGGCQQVSVTDGTQGVLLWAATTTSYWGVLATDLGLPISTIYPYTPPAPPAP